MSTSPNLRPYNVRVTYRERLADGSPQGVTLKAIAPNEADAERQAREVWHPQTVETVSAVESTEAADLVWTAMSTSTR